LSVALDTVAVFGTDLDLDERTTVPFGGLEADDTLVRAGADECLPRTASERRQRRGVADRFEKARLTGSVLSRYDGQPGRIGLETDLVEVTKLIDLKPGDVAQETRTGIKRYR
jgi:hypothetical protein